MNAQWLGAWDLGPKSHPGDGLLDVSDGNLLVLRPTGRPAAVSRSAPTSRTPTSRRRVTDAWQTDLDPSLDVWLDGEKVIRATSLSVRSRARRASS